MVPKVKPSPEIWAVINLTPDSFYAPSRIQADEITQIANKFLAEGADKLDIGAESSRPGSEPVSAQEEWARLEKALLELKKKWGKTFLQEKVSVDTYKAEVAQNALQLGVGCINDIQGGQDPDMFSVIARYGAEFVIMHMKGKPKTMQDNPTYGNVVEEVLEFLKTQSQKAIAAGISREKIIWDYGIGFGKTVEHNLKLLAHTELFLQHGYRLLVGISRKSFLGKLLDVPRPEDRKEASLVLQTYLALKNVSILRTHDVKACHEMRLLLQAVKLHEL